MKQPPQLFGQLLRDHRLRAGMTQRELARRAGMSVRAVRDIEQNRVGRPRARSARRLADAVGCSGEERDRLLAAGTAAAGGARLHIGVLGPLAVLRDDIRVEVGPLKLRCLLGLLAIQPNRVVSLNEIIDVLWNDRPPRTCVSSVHTYIRQLRELLEPERRHRGPARILARASGGYHLTLDGDQLDLARFDELVARAEKARRTGDAPAAHDLLVQALGCWRGRVLAGLGDQLRQHPAAVAVADRRVAAALAYADIAIGLGRYEPAAALLRALVGDEPMHEGLHARLMLVLAGCGQQTAALELYAGLRTRLVDELGVAPGAELEGAHLRVLRQDLPAPAVAGRAAPAQLPALIGDFVGRAEQLRHLDAVTTGQAGHRGAASLVAITGTAGVGKTALAVHWSHLGRDRFPDGQLYVDLRGHAPAPPLRAVDALVRFLHALGVPAQQVPVEVDEAASLYRSLLADKRMLVVLDNARDSAQVRPLLPGGAACLALITSRDRLSGLVAREGARRVALDVLTATEAHALLARILGESWVSAESAAAAELARACAQLPLALRIAAARLTGNPHATLARYVAELRSGNRLAAFEADDDPQAAVRATFHLSYATLGAAPRRLFRRLGLVPGPDVTAEAAGALIGVPARAAAQLLDRLAAGHLVGQPAPGRFACHDLLRLYARERADAEDDAPARRAAIGRLFDHYLAAVDAAARRLYPDMLRLHMADAEGAAQPAAEPPAIVFADHIQALAWLDDERPNLTAAVRYAAENGPRRTAWLLADALRGYFWARMFTVDWLTVARAGLAAADGQPQPQGALRLSLGDLHMRLGRSRVAIDHYRKALALHRQTGWRQGQVAALCNLGVVFWQLGQLRKAADHFTEAQRINRSTGRLEGQAATLGNLGLVYRELGLLAEAADHCGKALEIDRRIGSRMGEAIELANLGETYHTSGQFDRALDHLCRALALHRDVGDRDTEADTLQRLAAVHRDAGRHRSALELGHAALALARDNGNRRVQADAANTLGTIHQHLGRHQEAARDHRDALACAHESGSRYPQAQAFVGLATAYHHLGDDEPALTLVDKAISIIRAAEYRVLEGQALTRLAAIHLTQGRAAEAAVHARQARDLHRQSGHRLGEALAELVLAEAVPAEVVPAEVVPAEVVPAEAVPAEVVPAEAVPAEVVPADPVSEGAPSHRQRALALLTEIGASGADQVRALLPDRSGDAFAGHHEDKVPADVDGVIGVPLVEAPE